MKKIKDKTIKVIERLDRYSLNPVLYKFRMTEDEQKVFDYYVKDAKHYLEFGSGGSTLRVLQKSKAHVFSIESNEEWIRHLSKYLVIRLAKNKRLFFHYVNIGKTKGWGKPISNDLKDLFPNYSNSIFNTLDASKIDTVLVDGRFRVACVLSVILNTSSNDNIIILIHDFWNRDKYHVVLNYLTKIKGVDTLGIFKIKDEVDLEKVQEDYNKYKYIPD